MANQKQKVLNSKSANLQRFVSTLPNELGPGPIGIKLAEIYRAAAVALAEPILDGCTEGSIREGMRRVNKLVDDWLASPGKIIQLVNVVKQPYACKPGCNYCCHKRVTCLGPTALAVARNIKRDFTEEQLLALLDRIGTYEREKSALSAREFGLIAMLCPLNTDGMCTSYDARPLPCRAYHSFDVEKCIEDLENATGDIEIPGDANRMAIVGAVARAQRETLKKLGLNANELEFIVALRIALTQKDAGERYSRGENVFAEAHRPDVIEEQAKSAEARSLRLLSQ